MENNKPHIITLENEPKRQDVVRFAKLWKKLKPKIYCHESDIKGKKISFCIIDNWE